MKVLLAKMKSFELDFEVNCSKLLEKFPYDFEVNRGGKF